MQEILNKINKFSSETMKAGYKRDHLNAENKQTKKTANYKF